jgi:hypothetical protein
VNVCLGEPAAVLHQTVVLQYHGGVGLKKRIDMLGLGAIITFLPHRHTRS